MTKAELHALVDELPEESLEPAAVLLRRAQDPLIARLEAAPLDDEPLTGEDRAALEAAGKEPRLDWRAASAELRAE